jgi:hypothetical protein
MELARFHESVGDSMHPVVRAILQSGGVAPTDLYNVGDECSALTGGWVAGFNSGAIRNSLTKNASNITVKAGGTGGFPPVNTVVTNNGIDLTAAKTLKLQFSGFGAGTYASRQIYLVASTNKTANQDIYSAQVSDTYSVSGTVVDKIITLDVSALSGLHYIRVHARSASEDVGSDCEIVVSKVWLE